MNNHKFPENLPWLKNNTVLYTLSGSRAYGINTEDSDYDYKGIAVAPEKYYKGFLSKFEQSEFRPFDNGESVVYEIQKFFKLAADANPNILDSLFCTEDEIIYSSNEGRILIDNRNEFVSQKAYKSYYGYAISQFKKMESHRRWLVNKPKNKPERIDFGLPDNNDYIKAMNNLMNSVQEKVNSWQIDYGELAQSEKISIYNQITKFLAELQLTRDDYFYQALKTFNSTDELYEKIVREKKFRDANNAWCDYIKWETERNPKRKALEEKMHYDGKDACHTIRLLQMCEEILSGKGVIVKRPNREELLAIRNGALTFEQIVEYVEKQNTKFQLLSKNCSLPLRPNYEKLDNMCISIINKILNK